MAAIRNRILRPKAMINGEANRKRTLKLVEKVIWKLE